MAKFQAAFDKIFEHEKGYGYKKKPYRKDVYVIDNCFPVDFSKYHYADFRTAFEKSVSFEGGYVSPEYAAKVKDAGGETYMGISRNSNPDWPGWKIIDAIKKQRKLKWNEKINDPKLTALVYDRAKKRYWDVIYGDEIKNQQVAELIFELFWASGGLGIKQAQAALNKVISPPSSPVKVDGVFGGDTLNKINAAPQSELYSAIYNERKRFYEGKKAAGNPNANGWLKRLASWPAALVETGKELAENPGNIKNIAKAHPRRLIALGAFTIIIVAGIATVVWVATSKTKKQNTPAA